MSVTVGHMKQTNPHVAKMPDIMLKPHEADISKTQRRVHSAVQGAFYTGIPASTIPALVKDPSMYGIGVAIGAPVGLIYRLFTETLCPSNSPYLKDWKDWMEHSAAMNTTSKTIMGLINTFGIGGNVAAGLIFKQTFLVIAEGAIVGSIAGYEAAGIVRHALCPVEDASANFPSEPDENTSLNV